MFLTPEVHAAIPRGRVGRRLRTIDGHMDGRMEEERVVALPQTGLSTHPVPTRGLVIAESAKARRAGENRARVWRRAFAL